MENWKKAIEYYEQSIAADPNYALAHSRLSGSYKSLVGNSVLDPKEFTPKAEAAARKALELDDTLADAHYALANLKTDAWQWREAESAFAIPKSTTTALPPDSRMFSGLMSRCTTPSPCA